VKLVVVAVGQRVPAWAQAAGTNTPSVFRPSCGSNSRPSRPKPRGSKTLPNLLAAERDRIRAPSARVSRIVALDEHGTLTDHGGAVKAADPVAAGRGDVALVIGGPDGLDPAFKQPPMSASACPT
jgi:23S rRNA (pseudouridine1915-N3)-methyltransferase